MKKTTKAQIANQIKLGQFYKMDTLLILPTKTIVKAIPTNGLIK